MRANLSHEAALCPALFFRLRSPDSCATVFFMTSDDTGSPGLNVHFTVGEVDGYLHVVLWKESDQETGVRADLIGKPRRIDVTVSKAGHLEHALIGEWANAVTIGLESGLPIETYAAAVRGTRFEPAGALTVNGAHLESRRFATSVLDAVGHLIADLSERGWRPRAHAKQVGIDVIPGLQELIRRLS